MKSILSETYIRTVVTQQSQYSRHNINLFYNLIFHSTELRHTGSIKQNRYTIQSQVGQILRICTKAGMIGSDYKQCILEPRLMRSLLKKELQGMICVTDTTLKRSRSVGELTFITCRYCKRMMGTCRKHGSNKRLFEFRHLVTIVLQELFVPDSPCTIEILIPMITRIFIIFRTSEIIGKTS